MSNPQKNYNRLLHDKESVEAFVCNILGIFDPYQVMIAVNKILEQEKILSIFKGQPPGYRRSTGLPPNNRSQKIRNYDDIIKRQYDDYMDRLKERSRKILRKQILEELFKQIRPENDDEINFGFGGALPRNTEISKNKILYYIMGLPASGKSSIANLISDNTGSIIIDSDMAKRKLPEYNTKGGSTLVHGESDEIVMSGKDNLLKRCIRDSCNIIVVKIGHEIDSIINFIKILKDTGYNINLILVELDRVKATRRAYTRFENTDRYVPLSLIFDIYGNDPTLNFYKIIKHHNILLDGYAHINTDVKMNQRNTIVEDKSIELIKNDFLKNDEGKCEYVISKN